MCAWLFGLFTFARIIPVPLDVSDTSYDAIIVLTGGEARIDYGMALLEQKVAPHVFISGVSDGYSLAESKRHKHLSDNVTYGEKARDTFGNAVETLAWLKDRDDKALLIVTANYHMPRTELIFNHYLQAYDLDYVPVVPSQFHHHEWLLHDNSRRLVMSEYHKYLITWLRLLILRQ